MQSEPIVINFNRPIRLFPLHNCVLLPHAIVPLHIFEDRYRAMLRDALDSDGLIAMALFDGEDWRKDYEGAPPIRPHVVVGYLSKDQALPDGCHNILLQGVCRAEIIQEQPLHEDGYRLAMMKPYGNPAEQDPPLDEHALADVRHRLVSLLKDSYLSNLSTINAINNWLTDEIPTNAVIDLATLALTQDPDERYAVLAESDPRQRALLLEAQLRSMRDLVKRAEASGDARDENGWSLN